MKDPTKIKVLIIDDDEDDYIIIKHYLSRISSINYDVYWCNSFDAAVGEILADAHDLYLIDQNLDVGEGIEIIEEVRARQVNKPLILLTGAKDILVDEKAMEKGASDFLIKAEVKVDTLERTLRYALDRYQQQLTLKQQERKYRSLFELSMEPLLIMDEQFKIIEFNHSFLSIFGDQDPTPLAINFESMFAYHFDFDALIDKLRKQGFVRGFKTTLKAKTEELVVILSMAKLADYSSDGYYFQVAINDVSILMEAQTELRKLEKLSMTGRMARMIAHEVRNPLTNINLAVGELSAMYPSDEDAITYTEMITRNAKRIATLIDDLLTSSRPTELNFIQTNLQDIIDSAIHACWDRIELKGIDFQKVYPDELITGKWDAAKLNIAFVNIIINAVEAMSDTIAPKLSIFLSKEDDRPVLFIKDNGKGMDEETVNRIFDPFFTKRQDGLGLGMTATFNIITMHKGNIKVNSSLGKGTEFKVIL